MTKKAAILQSNYIPWKGYFDIIRMVDVFILYDEVQYTKNDWRNRNRIKTSSGPRWLTIPVSRKSLSQKICETRVADDSWRQKHWKTICQSYSRARFFNKYKPIFEDYYLGSREGYLSRINYELIKIITQILDINTKISWSTDYDSGNGRTEKLVDLCKQVGASEYISGPAAKGYIDPDVFKRNHILLTYVDYSGYPVYNQLYPPFEHHVTILDLIFNEGPEAVNFMKRM